MSTISSAALTTARTTAALQQAAQSIISGSTGSTMDVMSLVTAIVNAKIAGHAASLSAAQTRDNTQLSAIGTLQAALSALQAGLTPLSDGTLLSKFTATASGSGLTATAGTGAAPGSYSIGVTQIATSQALSSGAFGATQALGTGTLTVSLGGRSMSVAVTSSNNTLAGIASAINSAPGNPGVTATIVTGTDGAHLVLRSSSTGASNVISVAVSNLVGDNGLSSLGVTSTAGTGSGSSTIASAGTIAWTQSTAAQNAAFTVGGIAATSTTNAVTTAISGVTLNLAAASVGTTQTLTVSQDTASQATAITNFVNLYNTLVTTMNSLTAFNSKATSQGPLLGDSTLNTIRNTLASIVAKGAPSGTSRVSLTTIGIKLQADGTLQTNSATLNSALQSNSSTVASLFNATTGVGAQLNKSITSFVQAGGMIPARTATLNTDLTNLATQQSNLATYSTQLTNQYQAQFTALNTLMSTMNNHAQYLTQLFGGSNSAGALASSKG
jgi:flagellar hook-associated protein 2